ncbi:hypothetical protein, partial [Pseudarthrobacter sp. CCNWLW247]
FAITFTTRTVTKRLVLPVTIRLTVTIARAKTAAFSVALTAGPIAEGLTLAGTEATALTLAFAARTITIRLVLPVTIRLTLSGARRASGAFATFPVFPGSESARISA